MAVMKSGAQAIKGSVIGGQNSNTVGSDNTNLILKGKAIRVQWGNRFIDLIKDGKINVENQEILKTVSDSSSINEDGLYLIPETQEVWVCIDGQKINLTGGSYLSFMVEQQLTPEQKYLTLTNAGFYYQTLAEAKNIQGGIVYIEDEGKLYIVRNGQLQEYNFTKEEKKDELTIGDLRIYKSGDMTIESPSLILSINNTPYIVFRDQIKVYKDVVISNDAMIQSEEATSSQGFRLYNLNGLSTLEIDNIIEREKYEDNAVVYSKQSNLIVDQTVNEDYTSTCTLLYKNQFEVGDKIYALVKYTNVLTVEYSENTVTIKTTSPVTSEIELELIINDSQSSAVLAEGDTEEIIELAETIESFSYKIVKAPDNVSTVNTNKKNLFIFSVLSVTDNTIRINSTLDCINCEVYREPLIKIQQGTLEVIDKDKSVVKIGTLTEEDEEGNITEYSGIYSSCYEGNARDFFFNRYPKYNEGVTYPDVRKDEEGDENVEECLKSKYNQVVPNIAWIKKLISSYLPIGTIIMYNGSSEIPEDWTICDGSHGSPNLVGKFIKASADTVGETIVHENNEITLTADNLPKHNHPYTISEQTSTGTIGNTKSEGNFSGYNNDYSSMMTSSVFAPTALRTMEIITIPKDSSGNITDSTISNWGVTSISYDAGGINYNGYIYMDEHTHTLTMNPHSHTISEQEQEWKNTPIKVEPNYYSLIFIMKWK